MLEREDGLDESGDAGRRIEMSHVRLERSDAAVALAIGRLAKSLRDGPDLDRVADYGAGAVRFDVGDAVGTDAGEFQSFGDDLGLARRRWAPDNPLCAAPSLLMAEPRITRVDRVVIASASSRRRKHDDSQAAGKDRAARMPHRRTAVAVARKNLALAIEIALPVRESRW